MQPQCIICHNEGKEGGCPKCGRTPVSFASDINIALPLPEDIIPQIYLGKFWSKPENETLLAFKTFDEKLEKIHNLCLNGSLPPYSIFIASPPKSNKTLFVYSCMQALILKGYTIAPYLSTADIRRLLKISQINPFYKLFNKWTYETIISSDVLFLSISHLADRFEDIILLREILDSRARMNRATWIISDYKLQSLVPKWNSDAYLELYNTDPNRDKLRYPVILHRFE